ncbi:MAG: metallophosphoesterase [archaeon]
MDSKEILNFCLKKGFLLDKEILNLFSETEDIESVKLILEKITHSTRQKIITKSFFYNNKNNVSNLFSNLPEEKQKKLEKLKINLGLSIEISSEEEINDSFKKTQNLPKNEGEFFNLKIMTSNLIEGKKLEVGDFVKYFRNRFSRMRDVLQEHSELNNVVSINKISHERQGISIIGLISEKRVTKNKNIIFEVEDLTGKIKILINKDKSDLYKKAEEISLDSVIGFKGSGSREFFFASDIVFPDSVIFERKNSPVEEYTLFLGDLHFGSKLFLEKNFLKFIDYLNGKVPNTPEVDKIKYLFIVGDLITGVGVYPGQEEDLKINDLEEQFILISELLSKIRKDIKIIISPGNHEGVRLMEPQPLFDEKYAWPLYNLKNVVLTENPCNVKIGIQKNFPGFDILTYHGFSFPFYANNVPNLMLKKSMNNPEEIMKYLLKNRHLAPVHTSTQYFPFNEKDTHFIENVPDIFVSAHTHKSAVSYYNNILIISTSCWESMTPYQEKFGNKPDHCKVPMFNLKTRAMKILDFE